MQKFQSEHKSSFKLKNVHLEFYNKTLRFNNFSINLIHIIIEKIQKKLLNNLFFNQIFYLTQRKENRKNLT